MRSSLYVTLMSGAASVGALGLLDGYAQGFAFLAANGDGLGQVAVKDTTTAANNKRNVPAHNLITQSGTSPKLVKQPDGTLAWSPHNRVLYSEAFDSWSITAGLASRTAGQVDHLGGTTAVLVTENSGASTHGVSSAASMVSGPSPVRFVIRIKPNGRVHIALRTNAFEGGSSKNYGFQLTGSGSISRTGNATEAITYDSATGYYEIELTGTPNVLSSVFFAVYFSDASIASDTIPSYTGDGTSGAYLSRAEYYQTPVFADTYVKTTGAAKFYPAFEWDASPDTGVARWRMLVEPVATNLALYASDFTNAAWVKTGGGGISAAKTATGPDGVANSASTLTASGANGTALQAITSASASRVTSVWLKRRTGTGDIDLTQDNGSTWTTQAVTSTWTRFSLAAVTSANPTVGIRIVTSGDEVDVALFGHELGTVATSPIPTYGSTVTRAAGAPNFALSSVPWSATAGTLYWKGTTPKAAAAAVLISIDDGTANERFRIEYTGTNVLCVITDGGSAVATLDLGAVAVDTDVQVTFAWEADSVAASLNGGAVVTDTDTGGGLPTVTTFRIGYSPAGERGVTKHDKIVYVPERVANANLPTWRYVA